MTSTQRTMKSGRGLVALQFGGAAAGFMLLAFAPPAQGRMLLVPLTAAAAAALPARALDGTTLLIGAGPFAGSLVISGDRGRVAWPLMRAGVLTLAAPSVLCGAGIQDNGK